MNVKSVGKPSVSPRSSLYTLEHIQARNPINVRNVGNSFLEIHTSKLISELTQERNPMNVRNVPKPSVVLPSFGHI